jgi:hypothetical protein
MPGSSGTPRKNPSRASIPPAEAPIPTIGNSRSALVISVFPVAMRDRQGGRERRRDFGGGLQFARCRAPTAADRREPPRWSFQNARRPLASPRTGAGGRLARRSKYVCLAYSLTHIGIKGCKLLAPFCCASRRRLRHREARIAVRSHPFNVIRHCQRLGSICPHRCGMPWVSSDRETYCSRPPDEERICLAGSSFRIKSRPFAGL